MYKFLFIYVLLKSICTYNICTRYICTTMHITYNFPFVTCAGVLSYSTRLTKLPKP